MQPSAAPASVLHFKHAQPWRGRWLLAGVAAWVLALMLINATAPPEDDGLLCAGVFVLGPIGLLYAASWHEVVLDAADRSVTSRIGLLRWSLPQRHAFSDFSTVVVERQANKREEIRPSSQQGGMSYTHTSRWSRWVMKLSGPSGRTLSCPRPCTPGLSNWNHWPCKWRCSVGGGWIST